MRLRRYALGLAVLLALRGATKELKIEQGRVAQSEDGVSMANQDFLPGDTAYFSFRLSGYEVQEMVDLREKVHLGYHVEIRDPSGVLVEAPIAGEIATNVSPEDKGWMPKIRFKLAVPAYAISGTYHVSIQAQDDVDKSKATSEIPFAVHGGPAENSAKLEIRDFQFLRAPDDRKPLQIAAYRPGDTVWVRFDIAGYQLGGQNRLDVDYGVTVLRPNGEVMYSKSPAATEKTQSFYPQRWVPGILSLTLDKDLAPANYTLIVSAHDAVGNQTCELRKTFDAE